MRRLNQANLRWYPSGFQRNKATRKYKYKYKPPLPRPSCNNRRKCLLWLAHSRSKNCDPFGQRRWSGNKKVNWLSKSHSFPAVRMTANRLKSQAKGSRIKKALIDKKLYKVSLIFSDKGNSSATPLATLKKIVLNKCYVMGLHIF